MDTTPDNLSPCAVCGEEVSSDYKCPGCSRSIHHFCGTRLGDKREDPRHGDPILCNRCEDPTNSASDSDSDSGDEKEGNDQAAGNFKISKISRISSFQC